MKNNFLMFIFLSFLGVSNFLYSQISTKADPLPSIGSDLNSLSSNSTYLGKYIPSEIPGPLSKSKFNVDKSFEGFWFQDNPTENDGFRFIPPDPMGAAGKSLLLAVANSMIEARNYGGAFKWKAGLRDFFSSLSLGSYPFDPKIIYDQYRDRFVVVALERIASGNAISSDNISRILLAVSQNGNPNSSTTSDWYFQSISSKGLVPGLVELWADYPGFEVDEEAVYVTANMFAFPPFSGYGGVNLWIVDKNGLYDGENVSSNVYNPYSAAGIATTTMPAQIYGKNGAGSDIGTYLVSYSGLSDGLDEYVQLVQVNDPLGTPSFIQEFVNIGDIENFVTPSLPDAPQLGSPHNIEVNDRRALDAVWRDNQLWLTTTIVPLSGPDGGQTTAYWVNLNTSISGGATLVDQGGIGGEDIAEGTFTFYPSVAVNRDGHALFGFSASAPTIYAGAYVTGRMSGDTPGTVQASLTVKAGEAPYQRYFSGNRNRWGDYSGIAIDPSNDDFAWVFNEFADEPGSPTNGYYGPEDGRWGTAWGRVKFTGMNKSAEQLAQSNQQMGEVVSYELSENYPNPFNPSTTLSFAIPEDGFVTLKVYDILGKEVAQLENNYKPAGHYSYLFDASNLTSGIYFYTIRSGQFFETKRMLLMK